MAFKLASVSTLALTAALGMTMAACTSMPGWGGAGIEPVIEAPAPVQWVRDVHSHARPEIARVGHVDLDLTADFDRKVLSGKATLDISGREGADQIILDVRNLDIASVTDGGTLLGPGPRRLRAGGETVAGVIGTNKRAR